MSNIFKHNCRRFRVHCININILFCFGFSVIVLLLFRISSAVVGTWFKWKCKNSLIHVQMLLADFDIELTEEKIVLWNYFTEIVDMEKKTTGCTRTSEWNHKKATFQQPEREFFCLQFFSLQFYLFASYHHFMWFFSFIWNVCCPEMAWWFIILNVECTVLVGLNKQYLWFS